jgi:hypothetical protein
LGACTGGDRSGDDAAVDAPRLADLAAVLGPPAGAADAAFRAATAPAADLADPAHRAALLGWLNAWGCRIRVPRPGEPSPFDGAVAGWWAAWGRRLPARRATVATIPDRAVDALAAAYADLRDRPVALGPGGGPRRLGPTAAAKAVHALRPRAVVPWDAAIAARLHGATTADAFAAHQRLARSWAVALLAEAGTGERALVARLGRPETTLARLLDEYLYRTVTRGVG